MASKTVKKHIMISYQWGSQTFAHSLYKELTSRGFNVWMDIEGGMAGDIYQSMAEGVEGAEVIVPILTKKYSESPNCKRELERATDLRTPLVPVMAERFNLEGWLGVCVPGQLWYGFFNDKADHDLVSTDGQNALKQLCEAIDKKLPPKSLAKNMSIYIAYSEKDDRTAKRIAESLKSGSPSFDAILSYGVRTAKRNEKPADSAEKGKEPEKADKETVAEAGEVQDIFARKKVEAEIESAILNSKAVIVLLGGDTDWDEDIKNDINKAYGFQKVIIPISLLSGRKYPPKSLEFALKGIPYQDFSAAGGAKGDKFKTAMRNLRKAMEGKLSSGTVIASKSSNINFQLKNVGNWTVSDVFNWLRHINLHQYCQAFQKAGVNGKVLLLLEDKDLDALGVSKLQQKIFRAAIHELLSSFEYDEQQIESWIKSLGLGEAEAGILQKLQESGIDGKTLLMLSKEDLPLYGINNIVFQRRVMEEIHLLKEKHARVPAQDTRYRFKMLKNVLLAVATDEVEKRVRFDSDALAFLQQIFEKITTNNETAGLNTSGFKEFLLTVILLANMYHNSYPTKVLWHDATVLDYVFLKMTFKELQVDELIDNFEKRIKHDKESLREEVGDDRYKSTILNFFLINNIANPLFTVADRNVNGFLGWSETLMIMDLIVFGTMQEKFALAFSIIDNNGDGDLSADEYLAFYKECFLPLLHIAKLILGEDAFTTPGSFLYFLNNEPKISFHENDIPSLLSPKFSVIHYNGGTQGDHLKVQNILEEPTSSIYPFCSEKSKNIDLVLRYNNEEGFSLTNLWIGGDQHDCTCYLKDALLWVSDQEPQISEYTEKFNDFTQKDFDALAPDAPNRPLLFISTDADQRHSFLKEFSEPIYGKYVHLKLLNQHSFPWENNGAGVADEEEGGEDAAAEGEEQAAGEGDAAEGEEDNEEGEDPAKEAEDTNGGDKGENAENGGENGEQGGEEDKNIDLENLCLFGFNGKRATVEKVPTKGLVASYGFDVTVKSDEDDVDLRQVNWDILKGISQFMTGEEEPVEDMFDDEQTKKMVSKAAKKLQFLVDATPNKSPAQMEGTYRKIQPLMHLLDLFQGYSFFDVLQKPI